MKAIELLKEYKTIDFGCDNSSLYDEIDEAIEELEALQNKITRVEFISKLGRESVYRCDDNKHYELSFQDDNRTLKLFVVKDKE